MFCETIAGHKPELTCAKRQVFPSASVGHSKCSAVFIRGSLVRGLHPPWSFPTLFEEEFKEVKAFSANMSGSL